MCNVRRAHQLNNSMEQPRQLQPSRDQGTETLHILNKLKMTDKIIANMTNYDIGLLRQNLLNAIKQDQKRHLGPLKLIMKNEKSIADRRQAQLRMKTQNHMSRNYTNSWTGNEINETVKCKCTTSIIHANGFNSEWGSYAGGTTNECKVASVIHSKQLLLKEFGTNQYDNILQMEHHPWGYWNWFHDYFRFYEEPLDLMMYHYAVSREGWNDPPSANAMRIEGMMLENEMLQEHVQHMAMNVEERQYVACMKNCEAACAKNYKMALLGQHDTTESDYDSTLTSDLSYTDSDDGLQPSPIGMRDLLADTGASGHYAGRGSPIKLMNKHKTNRVITGVSNKPQYAKAEGDAPQYGMKKIAEFPSMTRNLLAVHQYCVDNNCSMLFDPKEFFAVDKALRKQIEPLLRPNKLGEATTNGLYKVNLTNLKKVTRRMQRQRKDSPNVAEENDYDKTNDKAARNAYMTSTSRTTGAIIARGGMTIKPAAPRKTFGNDKNPKQKENNCRCCKEDSMTAYSYNACANLANYKPKNAVLLMHQRSGHQPLKTLIAEANAGNTYGVKITMKELQEAKQVNCYACRMGRIHKTPFPKNKPEQILNKRSKRIIQRVHSDTAGPRSVRSMTYLNRHGHKKGGNKYWQIWVDDHSRYLWPSFMAHKSDLPQKMVEAERTIEIDARQSEHAPSPGLKHLKVEIYRTDNAGELTSKEMQKRLHKKLIHHETSVPHCSVQNAIAEVHILLVQDLARTIIADAGVDLDYWEFAIAMACWILNRIPCKSNPENKSRYEMFFGRKYDTSQCRSFGADCVIHLPVHKRKYGDKQMPAGRGGKGRMRFVGMPRGTKGYMILDTKAKPHPRIYVRRDVHWNEDMTFVQLLGESSSDYDSSCSLRTTSSSEASSFSSYSNEETDYDNSLSSPSDRTRNEIASDSATENDPDDSMSLHTDDSNLTDDLSNLTDGTDSNDEVQGRIKHTCKRGDTVAKFARRYNVNVDTLCRVNEMPDLHRDLRPRDKLQDGTELFLPTHSDEEQVAISSSTSAEHSSVSSEEPEQVNENDSDESKNENYKISNYERRFCHGLQDDQDENDTDQEQDALDLDSQDQPAHIVTSMLAASAEHCNGVVEETLLATRLAGKDRKILHYIEKAYEQAFTPIIEICASASTTTDNALILVHRAFKRASKHTDEKKQKRIIRNCQYAFLNMMMQASQDEVAFLVKSLKHVKATDLPTPKTLREALSGDHAELWNDAVKKELQQMTDQKVWKWAYLPKGRKLVDTKHVFKIKANNDGFVDRFKDRLVARGFRAIFGIDYYQTHASVVRKETVRLMTALAARLDLHFTAIDISGAFLEATLGRPIYAKIEGDEKPPKPGMVRELTKALYGVPPAPREWQIQFTKNLLGWGFSRSTFDPCLFYKKKGKDMVYICLYVDDNGCYRTKGSKIYEDFCKKVNQRYKASISDDKDVYLGMRFRRTAPFHYSIDQERYCVDAMKAYGFWGNTKEAHTPSNGEELTKEDCPTTDEEKAEMRKYPYANIIGTLRHLEQCTRPDISCALNKLSAFQSNPGKKHWKALCYLMRYVKTTRRYALNYGPYANAAAKAMGHHLTDHLHCFVDADWATCKDTRRSRTGYVFYSNWGPIAWQSKRQPTVALSTCEAEYNAASDAGCENAWLRYLLSELVKTVKETPINGKLIKLDFEKPNLARRFYSDELPTMMNEDNMGALQTANNPTNHKRMKHVDIKYRRIREFIQLGQVEMIYCNTQKQIADIMTKHLGRTKFCTFRDCLVQEVATPPLT